MLTSKSENRTGNTGKTIGWWQTMATPVGAERGGTIPEGSLWGITRAVSAEAESDAVKMGRTLGTIEATAYPTDGFWKLRWGVEIDGFVSQSNRVVESSGRQVQLRPLNSIKCSKRT